MPSFCRHNRLIQNCPICSREQAVELRPIVSSSAPRTSQPRPRSPSQSRARVDRVRSSPGVARWAEGAAPGPRSRRRLPARRCVPGLRSSEDAERLARGAGVRGGPAAAAGARSARALRGGRRPPRGPRGAQLAGVPDRLHLSARRRRRSVRVDPPGADAVGVRRAARPRRRASWARARPTTRPRRCARSRLTAPGRVAAGSQAAAFIGDQALDAGAAVRADVRAPRAARAASRRALRSAGHARTPRRIRPAGRRAAGRRRQRGHASPPSGRSGSATRCCSSAAPPTWRRRARCRSRPSTSASTTGSAASAHTLGVPPDTEPDPDTLASIRAALGL